jgi:hypothetical protein
MAAPTRSDRNPPDREDPRAVSKQTEIVAIRSSAGMSTYRDPASDRPSGCGSRCAVPRIATGTTKNMTEYARKSPIRQGASRCRRRAPANTNTATAISPPYATDGPSDPHAWPSSSFPPQSEPTTRRP